MTGSLIHTSLKVLLLLAVTLAAFRLNKTGLYKRYPMLFVYFILRIPGSVYPLILDVRSPAYFWTWLTTEPVFLAFHILVVFELYRLSLANYKGLLTIGKWAMEVFGGIAVIISALSLTARLHVNDPSRSQVMGIAMATQRGVDTSLAIFLILLILFLSRYPITLSRNVKLYAVIFPVVFLGNTLAFLIRTLLGFNLKSEANIVLELVSFLSVVAWLMLMSPKGELVPAPTRRLTPEHEARLLAQLDSLNATLLKSSRQH